MKGYIVKGIGGFYYVKTEEGVIECKPRGIFRKQKITPVAGDEVTLETENGAAVIAEIAPRKNVFVRPPVANLDVLFLVASTTQPTPSTLVLDKLSAIAVDKGVQPVIVCTKADLGEVEFLRSAYERSTLPFIAIRYDSGEGLDEVRQWISGRLCAFCGNSGVGKSTLINLVMRLYDVTDGSITIDGIDIRDYDQHSLRSQIGVVLQENFLFKGTIYNNIAYAKPGCTHEEVIRAARMANAHSFIMRQPDGYNTIVGERGMTLSGGERQRIAIARAVLRDPKILILDEATASLDTETEKQIQDAINALIDGRTTIAIAHRLSTLRNATKLVVLEKGGVEEVGTHDQLMRSKGRYYKLVMAQRQMSKMKK